MGGNLLEEFIQGGGGAGGDQAINMPRECRMSHKLCPTEDRLKFLFTMERQTKIAKVITKIILSNL